MKHIFSKVPSKISTIMVALDAGARVEHEKYSLGMSHMIEHMCFKGTAKRNYIDIAREIAFLGGRSNAFTSSDIVCYYVSVPYENVAQATEILSDMVFDSQLPEEEFMKEREVVREEALSGEDDVNGYMYNKFCEEFFGHRLGQPVIGTQESIDKFSHDELKSFYKDFYSKTDCVVALCGNHTKADAKKLLTDNFGKSTGFKLTSPKFEPVYRDARELTVYRDQLEHSYVWIAYPACDISDPSNVAQSIALSILGDGMDSRLFTEIREKNGLAYHIGSASLQTRDYSSTLITSSTRRENVPQMLELIEQEVHKFKTELVTEEELMRAKNKFKTQVYSITERSSSLATSLLNVEFFKLQTISEQADLSNKVTQEDVLEAANQLFDDSKKLTLICEEGK